MAADQSGEGAAAPQSPEDAEAQIQQLLQYGEQVRSDLTAVEEQRQMLTEVLNDYKRGREALKAIQSGEVDQEVLVPLGGSNYVPARLQTDGRKVLTGIGSGVHVENDVDAALERLASREQSASEARDKMAEQARELNEEMTRLNQHLQALSAAQGGGGGEGEE